MSVAQRWRALTIGRITLAMSAVVSLSGPVSAALPQDASKPSPVLRTWIAPQDEEGNGDDDAEIHAVAKAETEGDSETSREKERYFAITGGIVHTVSGPVLRSVTILCKDGRIEAVGPHVQIPEDAEVLDATGHHVYPGLVAARTFGVVGRDPAEDTTDVYSLSITAGLAGGLTTVISNNNAYKVVYGTLDDIVVKRDLFESIRYSFSDPRGKQRLRETFDRLRQHLRDVEAYELRKDSDPDAKAPDDRWIRGRTERYLRMLKGELVAYADADTVSELVQICDLARQYGLNIIIRGAREGWVVPQALAQAGASVILTPRTRADRDERTNRPNGSSIENAAILNRHGVPLAIVPASPGISFGGLGGRDLLHLRLEAAFGVRGGLSEDAAIRAVTLDAARIFGIDHRVGSIEVGKDADFVICDGDLLHYMTHARWTIVNGRIMYDKQQESLFDHIRPDGNLDAPPPNDHWPRRLGADF